MGGDCSMHWRDLYIYIHKFVVGTPEEKRPLGRLSRRWEDNFELNRKEMVCEDISWINLAQDRVQWRSLSHTTLNFWVP